jgi:hypothetical protein
VRRASPLAIHDFVVVIRVVNVGGFHTLNPDRRELELPDGFIVHP